MIALPWLLSKVIEMCKAPTRQNLPIKTATILIDKLRRSSRSMCDYNNHDNNNSNNNTVIVALDYCSSSSAIVIKTVE